MTVSTATIQRPIQIDKVCLMAVCVELCKYVCGFSIINILKDALMATSCETEPTEITINCKNVS